MKGGSAADTVTLQVRYDDYVRFISRTDEEEAKASFSASISP